MNGRNGVNLKADQILLVDDLTIDYDSDPAFARNRFETELHGALQRDEFLLHYQPKASCKSGRIIGVEALIRWQHPGRGLVAPGEFIPLLEQSELIVPVGEWVLRTACKQTRAWHEAGLGQIGVAVNLSGRQLEMENLFTVVKAALDDSGLEPGYLELELTESYLVQNPEKAIATLSRLKAIGVSVSVDDFGTGYSSLAYLKRFPLDVLKVDRSFIQDIVADSNDAAITRAVIAMAHSLKLDVVAEGVETEAQLGLLIANNCDAIQGYYFSRPVGADTLAQMLREDRRLVSKLLDDGSNMRTLLLVDDEEDIIRLLELVLSGNGYRVLSATSAEQGLTLLGEYRVDVVISDQNMPGMRGVEFLRRVKEIHPDSVRMMLSGFTDLQAVTDAINEGAIYKFLSKPWKDELLCSNIEEAFRRKEMAFENRRLSEELHAANTELVRVNDELRRHLHEKSQQVMRDEAALCAAQEVLQLLPWPYVGIDSDGMVAVASADAEALFANEAPLLGTMAAECLPDELMAWIESEGADVLALEIAGSRYRVSRRAMGANSQSSGTLLTLEAEGPRA
ncbi:MAG: EAL domain-containing protein [Burkholderiales bacterium]|nr:EAL domain-containing protein [Burkholderiales bacterium]